METSPLAQRLSTRFVAGETLDEALAVARKLNAEGITVTLDHLGESVTSLAEAAAARDVYLRTLDAIHARRNSGQRLAQTDAVRLDLSYEECLANVEQLVRRAAELGSFVRVDMESSEYTDRTLELVRDSARAPRLRWGGDSGLSLSQPGGCRDALRGEASACASARARTWNPETVAFPGKADVDRSYMELTRYSAAARRLPGARHSRRGHDRADQAFVKEQGIARDRFEFQMLYGIRRDLQRQLVAEGYRLRLYVPFGKAWYPYYMRRLAERPANVFFILRNLFRT